jgi:hypothetical protein
MTYKFIMGVLLAGVVLISCGTSQKFQASVSEDKSLFAAINELNKRPNNQKAQEDLKVFYQQSIERHEQNVDTYRSSDDPKRWDNILKELQALQHIYTSISASSGSASLVKPKNYASDIEEVKSLAAEDYYRRGTALLEADSKEENLEAFRAFKQVDKYVKGYKDVEKLMREAYNRSLINVVINPIEENNAIFPSFSTWGNDFRYRPEDYQQSLVRDLGVRSTDQVPAKFYTDRDARRQNIDPDWSVDIAWRHLDGMRSIPRNYNRRTSRNVQVGSDTSGRPIYKTVTATLHITQRSHTVRGDLDYQVRNLDNGQVLDHGTVSDDVSWTESYATYSGDSRALSPEDWSLINNRRGYNDNPTRGDILNTLMREMYPDLLRRLEYAIY